MVQEKWERVDFFVEMKDTVFNMSGTSQFKGNRISPALLLL